MGFNETDDFDLRALYAALDAERLSRNLSWQAVAREISALAAVVPSRAVSQSTVAGLRRRAAAEGDGVLQMLRWLRRAPESFVARHALAASPSSTLPDVPAGRILRFDTRRLYAAIDAQRQARGMAWQQVAKEIGGLHASALTRLAKGGRTSFPQVMRMTRWLGQAAASFTFASPR